MAENIEMSIANDDDTMGRSMRIEMSSPCSLDRWTGDESEMEVNGVGGRPGRGGGGGLQLG